jgi:tetratricopeptide (TPR) repeat protein
MAEGTEAPHLAAEEELSLAQAALASGDLRRAADHIAGLLAESPTTPGAHELLAELAVRSRAVGVELYPLDGPVSVGLVVARAHLLASVGEYEEAVDLLAAVAAHAPTGDWAGAPWVVDPELPAQLSPEQLARAFATVCGPLAEPVPAEQRGPLRPYLVLARNAARLHPNHPALLGAASALARRLDEPDLAIEWARQAAQLQPAKSTEAGLAHAYRGAGRLTDAIAAWQRALAYQPDDLSLYTEIATALADAGRLDEALGWAEQAFAIDPTDHDAVYTTHRLRFQRDGAVVHLVALADFAREHPADTHEHGELADNCAGRGWLGQMAPAGGPVAALIRRLAAQHDEPTSQVTLDLLPPPSAMNVLARAFPGVEPRIQRLLSPDIRTPRRAVGLRLWTFDGTTPVPAVPPPTPAGASALAELAQPTWPHPPAAYDLAIRLAAVPTTDLVGALVHPPRPPQTEAGQALAQDPAMWVRTVQVWACLGLLHHGADEPWGPSSRRRMLVDLAFGVEDWTTEAALFAMITAAWVDPPARSDVAALVRERLADIARVAPHRPVTIAWSLARLALMTPDLASDATRLAHEIIAAEEVEEKEEQVEPLGPGALVRRLFTARRSKA